MGRAKHALVVSCMAIPARWANIYVESNSTSDRYDKGIETQGQKDGRQLEDTIRNAVKCTRTLVHKGFDIK